MLRFILTAVLCFLPVTAFADSVTVTAVVPSPGIFGLSAWDTGRGFGMFRAPDVLMCLEIPAVGYRQCTTDPGECEDEYICTVTFEAPRADAYVVTLHDEDVVNDDYIGQGSCDANDTCYLGWAVITVTLR